MVNKVAFVAFVGAVALCFASSALAEVVVDTPYTVGTAGYGYTLALSSDDGDIVLATSPGLDSGAFIMKQTEGSDGEPSNQVQLTADKGEVTCGCITTVNDKKYLFAGLASSGYVVRVDLSFQSAPVYLNATDETLLWSGEQPLTLVSAVCKGQYIYFGSKSADKPNTILRLDTLDTDTTSRFRSLGPVTVGDFTQGASYGDNTVIFAAEPNGALPLTFFTINAGADFSLKNNFPVTGLANFDLLSSITPDHNTKRVVVSNANSKGRVAVIDLSTAGAGVVEELLVLSVQGISPITSFVVDTDSRYAYATLGACGDESDTAFVAIRLVPTLTQMERLIGVYNCSEKGATSASLLWPSGTDRRVLVLTQIDETEAKRDGAVVPFTVHTSADCPSNCGEASGRGECAGGVCYCYRAWDGADCSTELPCGGTDCNGNGVCNADAVCECEVGFSGSFCDTIVPCPLDCSNHGTCNKSTCICHAGFVGAGCELIASGCSTLGNCNGHGTCQEGHPVGTCTCEQGWLGDDCATKDVSCKNDCSDHGVCINAVCECEESWTGEDCSLMKTLCPHNCSGHGICNKKRCFCFHGFKGLDCSVVDGSYCFNGCTGHGTCIGGLCVCEAGWKGSQCDVKETDLHFSNEVILVAGENKASTSFVSRQTNEVVFCVGGSPPKCVSFDPKTMLRLRESSLDQSVEPVLLETAEGKQDDHFSLIPEFSGAMTSVSMVELGQTTDGTLISAAVVNDAPNGFAILGTRLDGESEMHGQLFKVALNTLERVGDVQFEEDMGNGVTAGCLGPNSTYIFASGSNPAYIYSVNSDLEIRARTNTTGETPLLLWGGNLLIAASRNVVSIFDASSLSPSATTPNVVLDLALGDVTSGFVDVTGDSVIAYLGTSASPGVLVKLTISSANTTVEWLTLSAGENRITSMVRRRDSALLGLGTDGSTCSVVEVLLSSFAETDTVDLKGCTGDLVSASVSSDGSLAFFGSNASPAHIYSIRLVSRDACPKNCSGHGFCYQGKCSCRVGWIGDSCQTAVPLCPNNCSHAGTCINGTCNCRLNHFGNDCSVIEMCADSCQNGECTGANSTWPCTCETNWEGQYCSEPVASCPNDCSNHGACQSGACTCETNFKGEDCSTQLCNVDDECSSHMVCAEGVCVCREGWSGDECEIPPGGSDGGVSPALIGVLVAAALIIGMIAGVSIWKSWMNNSTDPNIAGLNGGSRVGGGGGYTRLPRRLVK